MATLDMNKLHNHLDLYMKILLSKYPQTPNIYANGMFKTKTKSVTSLTVLRYLLKILVPGKLARVLWPLYDNRMEAEFRRLALEILNDIFKGNTRVHTINMSVLITSHSVKFVHTLVNLCAEILKRDVAGVSADMGSRINQLEHVVERGEEEGVKELAQEVERVATFRLSDQLVAVQQFMEKAKIQASELTSSIKGTETAITQVELEANAFVTQHGLADNLLHEHDKMQEFHHQVAGQASRLNKLTAHTATLLGNIPECDSLALLPLHQLNGGEGEPVDLMGVVTHARQFRISSPMMTLFGDGESEQPACVGLVRQFTSLVLNTDQTLDQDISEKQQKLSSLREKYTALTEKLKKDMQWKPSIPESKQAIIDPDLLNRWESNLRLSDCESKPETVTNEMNERSQTFLRCVRQFLETRHKEEQKIEEEKKKAQPKISLAAILFSDTEETRIVPPQPPSCNSISAQNGCQQQSMMSPTTSNGSSPLACSSRLMSSLASTPVKKYEESYAANTPLKKHEDSLLRHLLYNKMSEREPSPTRGSPTPADDSPSGGFNNSGTRRSSVFNGHNNSNSFNYSFELAAAKLPSNLSQTTCESSPSSFLDRSVLTPPRRMSNVFDALLDESSPSTSFLRAQTPPTRSPLVALQPETAGSLPSPLIPPVPGLVNVKAQDPFSPAINEMSRVRGNAFGAARDRFSPAVGELGTRNAFGWTRTAQSSGIATPVKEQTVGNEAKSLQSIINRYKQIKEKKQTDGK